jgi:ABC-2 type transport system ATP-binding protein
VLIEALRHLDAKGIDLLDVALRRPTLDDVFLTLTGHAAEIAADDADDASAAKKGGKSKADETNTDKTKESIA